MPQRNSNISVNPHFIPFFQSEERFCILYGGAGSGKSIAAAQKVIQRCLQEPGHRFLVTRKVHKSIKDSCFHELVQIIEQAGLKHTVRINNTDLSITFHNGSKIITAGMDDPEKIKSTPITSTWCEEPTAFDLADLQQINLRLRGKGPGYFQHILTFNPISETHWIKEEYFDRKRDDTFIQHSTYLHNEFIDPGYEAALNTMAYDDNLKRIYLLGEWGRIRTGLEFYSAFRYHTHVTKIDVIPEFPIHVSFDQNVIPYCCATVWQVQKDEFGKYHVNCIDEIALSNPRNKTEEVCKELIARYGHVMKNGCYYYGDATGRKRDTRGMVNDYDIVERELKGYISNHSNRVPVVNPGVSKRRDFINRMLTGSYPIELRVNEKCKLTIADFENVKEAEDRTKLKERKRDKTTGATAEEYGHCFTGDTLIETTRGPKPIRDVFVGDYVYTLDGYKRVAWRWDNGYKHVETFDIDGHVLCATPDHRVAIFNKNTRSITWNSLKDCLSLAQNYVLWKNGARGIQSITMAGNSQNTPNRQTYQIGDITKDGLKLTGNYAKLIYTAISGIRYMENRLKVIMFTISTAILIITTLVTLSVLQLSSILANIGIKAVKSIRQAAKNVYSNLVNRLQLFGIKAKQGESGIKNTLKNQYSSANQSMSSAKNVEQFTSESQRLKTNIAQQDVKTGTMLGGGVLLNFMELVCVKYQKCINSNLKQRVYDLTVEDAHHYFANGVLVHNCSDTADYFLCENFRFYFDR